MTEPNTFVLYPVLMSVDPVDPDELAYVAAEAERLFQSWADRVKVRGYYTVTGFRADADLLMWWVANSPDDLQDLLVEFRRTQAGRAMELAWSFMGAVRPPETAPDHVPAFVRGAEPKKYLNVYPFVRSAEWYLMPAAERAELLREHGEMGRGFPDVLANTTSGFGLGDWEWILAFEADDLTQIVDCIRYLRASKTRLYTKEEVPFVTGVRKPLAEVLADVL